MRSEYSYPFPGPRVRGNHSKSGYRTAFVIAVGLSLLFSGCQRSMGFRRDQDGATDAPGGGSYYNRPAGRGSVQRTDNWGQPKKRVLVFGFWNHTPIKQPELGAYAADELKRVLYQSARVIVPEDLKTEFSTEDFLDAAQGDKVKVAQLIREARRLGVGVVVIGRISRIIFRQKGDDVGLLRQKQSVAQATVEAKIFDVTAGREIEAASHVGENSNQAMSILDSGAAESAEFRAELIRMAVRGATEKLVPDVLKAVDKMTWQGRVAKVMGGKVYVNAGRAAGLINGDILKVVAPGTDVFDPASGAFLGRTQGQLKGTLEVADFIGPDAAVAEVHTGGNFQEGDIVQLY